MSDDTKGRQYRPPAFVSGHAALEQEARQTREALRTLIAKVERASHLICIGRTIEGVAELHEAVSAAREVSG